MAFLDHQGQHPSLVIDTIRTLSMGLPVDIAGLDAVRLKRSQRPIPPPLRDALAHVSGNKLPGCTQGGVHNNLMCEVLHPGTSCVSEWRRYFMKGLVMALPVYAPVFIVPTLLFQSKSVVKAPLASALRVSKGIARSCVFLSGYCTLAISFVCWGRNFLGIHYPAMGTRAQILGLFAGLLSGLANLVEKPARRIEVSCACCLSKEARLPRSLTHLLPTRVSLLHPSSHSTCYLRRCAVRGHAGATVLARRRSQSPSALGSGSSASSTGSTRMCCSSRTWRRLLSHRLRLNCAAAAVPTTPAAG